MSSPSVYILGSQNDNLTCLYRVVFVSLPTKPENCNQNPKRYDNSMPSAHTTFSTDDHSEPRDDSTSVLPTVIGNLTWASIKQSDLCRGKQWH